MITQKLNEFKVRHGIKSADKWAEICKGEVSKSTIARALKGDHKDIGVYTLEQMLKPWGSSIDELLGIGAYSPEAIEKEELKNDVVEKIEGAIETIESSPEIPHEPTREIKTALEKAQEYITNESPEPSSCVGCSTLREMIATLEKDKSTKDTWLLKLFGITFIFLVLFFVCLVIIGVLSTCLINLMK
jgi:hypothetical protein